MRLFKPNIDKMLAKKDVDGLIKTLDDPDQAYHKGAREALIKIGEPAVARLSAVINHDRPNVRIGAAWALGDIGEKATGVARVQAMEALIRGLRDTDWTVCRNAAIGLGQICDPCAIEPLINTLTNTGDEYKIWHGARESLTKLGLLAVGSLIAALNHADGNVRRGVAWVLGDIGDLQAIEPLINTANDQDAVMRQNVASALGRLGTLRVIPVLTVFLKDQAVPVRRNAVNALGNLHTAKSAVSLADHFDDPDPDMQTTARQALFGLLATVGDTEKTIHDDAIMAINGFGQTTRNALITALGDQNSNVRQNAAIVLGKLGDETARGPLLSMLNDRNKSVRRDAAKSLDALGWKSSGTTYDVAYWAAKGTEGKYQHLHDLLEAKSGGAERETRNLLHNYLGGRGEALPRTSDIQKIPCETLLIVDALWRYFSDGESGLSLSLPDSPDAIAPFPNEWAMGIALDYESEYEYADFTLRGRRFQAAKTAMKERARRCWAASRRRSPSPPRR